MSHNRRKFSIVFGGLVLLLCCSLPIMVFGGHEIPDLMGLLGPTSPPEDTIIADLVSGMQTQTAVAFSPSETALAPVCGGPSVMYILLIGSDTRGSNYAAGLADSIRIVRVDFINPGVTMLSFQRDLYVEIPGIASHGGITHGKLNQAYLYGNTAFGYFDGPGEGPGLLKLTMEQNFGALVDHYVAVNMRTFVGVVDALGGLDLDLPYIVDGRVKGSKDSNLYFPAGYQHLDGYRTMLLARMRPDGDLQRSHTQDLILQALAAKLLTPMVFSQLPGLIQSFQGSVQTDLGQAEIGQLLCLAAMLDQEKVEAVNFPEELFRGTRIQDPVLGNTFIWDADFNLLRAYVQYFNYGLWPEPAP